MKQLSLVWIAALWLILGTACGTRKHADRTRNTPHTAEQPQYKNRAAVVDYAQRFLGTPYVYGGTDPKRGFDCSGFVQYVYHHFGINVPRTTKQYVNYGKRVERKQVKPADLLLFSLYDDYKTIGHIGIVSKVSDGRVWFIHAASGKGSGKVMISELEGVHIRRLKFITRVVD